MSVISGNTMKKALSTSITTEQKNMLSKVKDPAQKAQMEAQFKMQNYQNMTQFISNIMRIKGDISKAIISNVR